MRVLRPLIIVGGVVFLYAGSRIPSFAEPSKTAESGGAAQPRAMRHRRLTRDGALVASTEKRLERVPEWLLASAAFVVSAALVLAVMAIAVGTRPG
jgi:hypothetical protein